MITAIKPHSEVRERLLDAAQALFFEHWYDEVDLDLIASRAGVDAATAARVIGDKRDIFMTMVAVRFSHAVEDSRYTNVPGDLDEAIASLLDDYEYTGDAVLRALALEERLPELREALERGRQGHRCWIAYSMSALVEGLPAEEQALRLELAATVLDVYVWKLHRRDQGRSREETAVIMRRLAADALGIA
jgi:AcrR family transcriptional regulator